MRVREEGRKHRSAEAVKPVSTVRKTGVPAMDRFGTLQRSVGNRGLQAMIAGALQMKTDSSVPIQRMESEEEEELQMKSDPLKEGPSATVQRKGSGGGSGLPEAVQRKMESAFQADFSSVRVHEGGHVSDVGALAYTQGNDIHFAPGKYQPESSSGQALLGHELAHVVQQREGRVKPTGSVAGLPLNDSPVLESEADQLGARAAAQREDERSEVR